MNAGRCHLGSRQRELRHLGGLGIEPHHGIAAPVIRDPEHPILVLDRAPRPHAVVGPEVVLHIGDVHGLRAERTHQGFVLRQILGRLRLRRVRTERGREIGHEVFESVVAHATPLHHHVAHVFDPLTPAVLVPGVGRHALLKRVAGLKAGREERVLIGEVVLLGLGQQLSALVGVQVAPAHHRLLKRKIERNLLVVAEPDIGAGIGLMADSTDLHRVGRGRQVADVIAALRVRQDAHGHLVLRVLGDDERTHEGRAVRSLHVARDRRRQCRRRQENRRRERNQNPARQIHEPLLSAAVSNARAAAICVSTAKQAARGCRYCRSFCD